VEEKGAKTKRHVEFGFNDGGETAHENCGKERTGITTEGWKPGKFTKQPPLNVKKKVRGRHTKNLRGREHHRRERQRRA